MEYEKEFICRQCNLFLDNEDLIDGKCPQCGNDDTVFNNDLISDCEDD